MYKISDKIIKVVTKVLKNWKMELATGGKILVEGEIQKGIFLGDSFRLLQFVIKIILLNYIKCKGGFEFTKSLEKINHLLFMDEIENQIGLKIPVEKNKNIQPDCRNGI